MQTNVYPPLTCDLHTGSGIGASSGFHQSHLLSMLVLLLWHRGCLSDITGALFCCPGTKWMVSSFTFCFCVLLQSAFLHVFVKNDILQLGAYDHRVLYATAQLTEGRSARDQPKQPPAKKIACAIPCMHVEPCGIGFTFPRSLMGCCHFFVSWILPMFAFG